MKMRLWAVVVALLSAVDAWAEARLLRHPSYHQGQVVFSYLGDLWLAKEDGTNVTHLTTHRARDIYPRFSPDGSKIAFSSNREGNYDVYVIPVAGGRPTRLTYHSADDLVVGWSRDGKKIYFSSTRGNGAFPSVATLWEISVDGGMEKPLPTDWGTAVSFSRDSSKMAFTRHPAVWSRKHYRGAYNADLWVMTVADKSFVHLAADDYTGNCLWPMYAHDGQIYFVADRLVNEKGIKPGSPEVMKSVNNIWKVSEQGGAPVQVTHHAGGNLFFPCMSQDGQTIVYEENFGLWKLDVATGNTKEIRIDIASDIKDNDTQLRSFDSEAEDYDLSPSGRRAAITTHGEIFTIAVERGDVQRVTESAWRDQRPRWSPDGKRIAFLSDRTGREEIWSADEFGQNLKKLSDVDCDKSAPIWSPDAKFVAWTGSNNKLHLVNVETGATEVLTSSNAGPISGPQISPDGKWIAYTKYDALSRSRVYVKPLPQGEEKVIAPKDFLVAMSARWTPDGKRLVILGGTGTPAMAALNRTPLQIYSIALTREDQKPNDRDINSEAQAQAAADAARNAILNLGKSASKPNVKIDWDGLDRRVRQVTRINGSVSTIAISPDSRTYAFVASGSDDSGAGLFTIGEDGTRLTTVAQVAPTAAADETADRPSGDIREPQWSRSGRGLYFLQGRSLYSASVAAPTEDGQAASSSRTGTTSTASTSPRKVSFTVRMEVDQVAERQQVFSEAWRVMKYRFYDPKMHGVDWEAARKIYEPVLAHVRDTEELHAVIMEMIGELNASHTGVTGGSDTITDRVQSRHPGFELEPDASGYYKVAWIYKKGPADFEYVKLAKGNFILSINGKELRTSDNYWKRFNVIPGRRIEFTVNSKPETAGAWKVSIEPVSAATQSNLEYERWVDRCRTKVDELSQGQIGYLHIRSMNASSFQRFQRELLDNLDKKALVIDQRFNGGGGIDQELLGVLAQRKAYQTYRRRDSVEIKRPAQGFFGPMVVMQNERSASNAEMFPDGFRTLGLGKVVGVPTMGAVIGTGSYRLLDGSSIRTPGVGVYTVKGQNMENYGVPPDVLIDNTPADFLAGHDRQLEKSVEVLQQQLKKRPR